MICHGTETLNKTDLLLFEDWTNDLVCSYFRFVCASVHKMLNRCVTSSFTAQAPSPWSGLVDKVMSCDTLCYHRDSGLPVCKHQHVVELLHMFPLFLTVTPSAGNLMSKQRALLTFDPCVFRWLREADWYTDRDREHDREEAWTTAV